MPGMSMMQEPAQGAPKDPLTEQLDTQWKGIQKTLKDWHGQQQQQSHQTLQAQAHALGVSSMAQQQNQQLLHALSQQQQTFMQSMERMAGLVQSLLDQQGPSHDLASAIREMKDQLGTLPEDLGDTLSSTLRRSRAQPGRAVSVSVSMPASLTKKLDALEEAVTKGLKRVEQKEADPKLLSAVAKSRNRTFGSNY